MTEDRVIRAAKGVFLFVAFLSMGLTVPHANLTTLLYLQHIGINSRTLQLLFIVSAIANLCIGLSGFKWNALWFATWVSYSSAALVAYMSGASIPLLAVAAYLLLSVYLTIDVLVDAELYTYIRERLWKTGASLQP